MSKRDSLQRLKVPILERQEGDYHRIPIEIRERLDLQAQPAPRASLWYHPALGILAALLVLGCLVWAVL